MKEKNQFLSEFYDKNKKEGKLAPVYLTDSKEDWIDYLDKGEIVDNCFVYSDTMSVLLSGKDSCMVSFLIITEDYDHFYQNLTLRFDGDRARLCGFDESVELWDDTEINTDLPFKLSKNMERSLLKQLHKSLNKQFKDEAFKDHLNQEEKIKINQYMKMTDDFLNMEEVIYSYNDYKKFIDKYKLESEIEKINDFQFKIKPSILVDLERTKETFSDYKQKEEKFELIKYSLKNYIDVFLKNKDKELEYSVEGSYSPDFGELYLKIEDSEFKHSYLERQEDESSYEDAPSSWTWAAWLLSDESPLVDEDFKINYQETSLLQALDQFVHTLDNSDYFFELEKELEKFQS